MGVLPLRTGIESQPKEMYSGFLLPDLSVYTRSGFLLISSSTHGGNGILKIQDTNLLKFITRSQRIKKLIKSKSPIKVMK